MRVLLTSPTYPPFNSGLGNAVREQARFLSAAGYEVVVATGGAQRASREDSHAGAVVEQFNVSGADVAFNPVKGEVDSYLRFLRAGGFDLVVLNAWQNWATDLALRHLPGIPGRKILFSHCISTNLMVPGRPLRSLVKYLAWRPYWRQLPRVMRQLDGLLFLAGDGCDSRFDDLRLARKLDVPHAIVPNALSAAALGLLEQPSYPLQSRGQLIAIGSWDWFKGHDFVLRAYAASSLKNRVPLQLFGQHFTPYTQRLKTLAARLGLETGMVGFHEGASGDSLLKECARSRLLLSGSVTECQPLVLLDSMAAGTPFVARATGCIPGLQGGVSVADETAAAQAIDQLWSDSARWQSTSDAGREHVRRSHHPDAVAAALLAACARFTTSQH